MKEEVWKDIFYVDCRTVEIIDYRGLYQVSNFGRIKSLENKNYRNQYKKEFIISQHKDNDNRYMRINLYKDGKLRKFRVHRLVAEMFIPNPNNLPEVNHIDENKFNNCVDNLEWCTSSKNVNHGTRNKRVSNKLSEKRIGISLIETKVVILKSTKNAYKFGFDGGHISECCSGKRKSHKKYKWYKLEEYSNMAILSQADESQ